MITSPLERAAILALCDKVEEVLNNNDWPTEEGMDSEDGQSYIRSLVEEIRLYAETKP